MSPPAPDQPDATINAAPLAPRAFASGRYVVKRLLPAGGQKTVYLVHDTALDRDCALALIKADRADADDLERLRREAQAMARLGAQSNIVGVYDIGDEDGSPYLTSEYIAGGDLRQELTQANGPLPLPRAIAIAADVATGLAAAHGRGIIHRDIKPGNILLTEDGSAKLGDFGLALAIDRSHLTSAGTVLGTAAYMPPEQSMGQPADARSDLYALGCVLYEMVTGRPPFLGDDALAVISQHVNTAPVAPSWHNAAVPSPLEDLILRLLAKAPADRPASAIDVGDGLHRIAQAPDAEQVTPAMRSGELRGFEWGRFVGREEEMDALKAIFEGTCSGEGQLVTLVGEPGIGKTRLAEQFAVYAGLRGAQVLLGRCYEGEVSAPYRPFVEAFRQYARSRPDAELRVELGPGAPEVATLVTEIRQRLPDVEEAPKLEPDAERLRLFDSVTDFVRSASKSNPLILFLDDIHWADKPTLLMLQHLARNVAGARVLIIAPYRDVELDRTHPLSEVLASLRRLPNFHRLLMRGLSEDDVRDLLTAMQPSDEAEPRRQALADALHRETEGNPFFIREVLTHLVEEGHLRREGGRWTSDATSITALGIPEGVREVIGRRLSRLSDGCNRLLTLVSMLNGGFSWQALTAVSGEDEATLLDLIDEALAAQLIYERKGDGAGMHDFTHALIRQTLYEELSGPRRVVMHRRIAVALEQAYGGNVEPHLAELAYHFYQATPGGDLEKAVDYATRAGQRATALFAWEEAVAHYERALQVIDLGPAPDERLRIDLLLALAEARLSEGGDDNARKESALRAADIARQIGDRERFGRAALSFAGPRREDGVLDPQLVALIEEAIELIGHEDSGLRAMLLVRLSIALWFAGARERQRMRALTDEAFAIARRLGDKEALVYVLARGVWAWDPGNTEEQIANAKEMLALALEAGNKSMAMEAYSILVGPLLEQGNRDGADAAIDAYIGLQHEVRRPGWGTTWRAMQAAIDGRLADVEPLATQGYAELQKLAPEIAVQGFGSQLMGLRRAQGRLLELEGAVRSAADQYPALPVYRALLAVMYAEAGRLDDARAPFEAVAGDDFVGVLFDRNWPIMMSLLADACTLVSDRRRAGILYEMARPYEDLCVVATASCIATLYAGSLHLPLGGLAATLSRWADAERHYEAAISMDQQMRAQGWVARSRLEYAQMLALRAQTGDRERVLALLDEALAAAREMGMARLVETGEGLRVRAAAGAL